MLKRFTTMLAALAALGAFALGGSVIASATQHAPTHHPIRAAHHVSRAADHVDSNTEPSGGSDKSVEAPSSESDGPGGHQDPPGANVDNQQQGQN